MAYLWDVNVLIARTDVRHEHHERMLLWVARHAGSAFVTCPITENGFLRIYGHPAYPGGPGSPSEALVELRHIRALPNHEFVADSLSLGDTSLVPDLGETTPRQLTDVYLLALAVRHGLEFVTFGENVAAAHVVGGSDALHVVG